MVSNSNKTNQSFRESKTLVDCNKWVINTINLNQLLACVGEDEVCYRPAWKAMEIKGIKRCCEEGLVCKKVYDLYSIDWICDE